MAASEISDLEVDASEPAIQSIGSPGTTAEADGSMRRRVAISERKLIKMEERIKDKKKDEIEFVDTKQLRPEVLKDGAAFKVWRKSSSDGLASKLKGCKKY